MEYVYMSFFTSSNNHAKHLRCLPASFQVYICLNLIQHNRDTYKFLIGKVIIQRDNNLVCVFMVFYVFNLTQIFFSPNES